MNQINFSAALEPAAFPPRRSHMPGSWALFKVQMLAVVFRTCVSNDAQKSL